MIAFPSPLRRGAGYLLLGLGATAVVLSPLALVEGVAWILLLPLGVVLVRLGRRVGAETRPLWIRDTLFETYTTGPFAPGVRFRSSGFAIAFGLCLLVVTLVWYSRTPHAPGYPAAMGERIEALNRVGEPLGALLAAAEDDVDPERLDRALTEYLLALDGTVRWMGRTDVPPELRAAHEEYREELRRSSAVMRRLRDGVRKENVETIRSAARDWGRTAPRLETALDRLTARLAP